MSFSSTNCAEIRYGMRVLSFDSTDDTGLSPVRDMRRSSVEEGFWTVLAGEDPVTTAVREAFEHARATQAAAPKSLCGRITATLKNVLTRVTSAISYLFSQLFSSSEKVNTREEKLI